MPVRGAAENGLQGAFSRRPPATAPRRGQWCLHRATPEMHRVRFSKIGPIMASHHNFVTSQPTSLRVSQRVGGLCKCGTSAGSLASRHRPRELPVFPLAASISRTHKKTHPVFCLLPSRPEQPFASLIEAHWWDRLIRIGCANTPVCPVGYEWQLAPAVYGRHIYHRVGLHFPCKK